jgi:hypothetical protein
MVDLNIRRISSTVRASETTASAEAAGLGETDLDRLAAILLERQQRLLNAAAATSLAPDDPAGELGSWH